MKWGERRALTAYYMATPLFAGADALGLAPFRVAGLEAHPGLRWTYYAGAFAFGLVCHSWPRTAPWVGMGESSLNLLLLLVAFLTPIWSLPARVAAGGSMTSPVTGADLANLVLVGGVLLWTFYRNQARARGP